MGDSFFAEAFFLLEKKGRSCAGAETTPYTKRTRFMRFNTHSRFFVISFDSLQPVGIIWVKNHRGDDAIFEYCLGYLSGVGDTFS